MDAAALLHDAHEGLGRVVLAQDLPHVLLREVAVKEYMAGGEDPAHHLDRGGREVDLAGAELLKHLRHVAVPRWLVGAYRAAALGVMARVARCVAAFARSGLHLHHRIPGESAAEEGAERENRGSRVAAGAGDEVGTDERVAVQLRHSIDEFAEQVGARMLAAVPASVTGRVPQPEVGAQVDNPGRKRAELIDAGHRLPVRQAQEQHVAGFEFGHGGELEPRASAQVRVRVVHELPGEALRRRLAHLDARVEPEKTQQLAAGVPGCSDDRDPDHDFGPMEPFLPGFGDQLIAFAPRGTPPSGPCAPLTARSPPDAPPSGPGCRRRWCRCCS